MNYAWMSRAELLEVLRLRGVRIRKGVAHERLVELASMERPQPQPSEVCETMASRKRLEVFLQPHLDSLSSYLPCKEAPDKGRCTTHNCSDMRHMGCLISAEKGGHLL